MTMGAGGHERSLGAGARSHSCGESRKAGLWRKILEAAVQFGENLSQAKALSRSCFSEEPHTGRSEPALPPPGSVAAPAAGAAPGEWPLEPKVVSLWGTLYPQQVLLKEIEWHVCLATTTCS